MSDTEQKTELATTMDDPNWHRPASAEGAMRIAKFLSRSALVPKDFQNKPDDIVVAMMYGRELGLGTLAALQNIAVINGRPTVWGDSALAIVQQHPDYEFHREWIEGEGDEMRACCYIQRRGAPEDAEPQGIFSVADAKLAGLLGNKQGPWKQYPKRMLQCRARGFAIRNVFADALRGVSIREEVEDIQPARDVAVFDVEPGTSRAEQVKDALARKSKKQLQVANREAREETIDDVEAQLVDEPGLFGEADA